MANDLVSEGRRQPTLQDVARVAGVSRATVSRVINNVRNVDPEISRVVAEAVAATGYVPNRAARSLVTGRVGTMALVVSVVESQAVDDPFMGRFLSDPFFGRVVGGLSSVFRKAGVHLSLMLVGSDDAREQLLGDLRSGRCDGAAVLSLNPHDSLPEMLADAGVPAVLWGRPMGHLALSHVDLANADGAGLAAAHLLARGCRRIGTISGPGDSAAGRDRMEGFTQALKARGVINFSCVQGDFTQAGGEAAMENLLRQDPKLDGVFVASDVMAAGALPVIKDTGRRVPEDVALVGFDDSSVAATTRPPLTTVRQPVEDMAAEMGRLLISQADSAAGQRRTSVIFQPALILRESA